MPAEPALPLDTLEERCTRREVDVRRRARHELPGRLEAAVDTARLAEQRGRAGARAVRSHAGLMGGEVQQLHAVETRHQRRVGHIDHGASPPPAGQLRPPGRPLEITGRGGPQLVAPGDELAEVVITGARAREPVRERRPDAVLGHVLGPGRPGAHAPVQDPRRHRHEAFGREALDQAGVDDVVSQHHERRPAHDARARRELGRARSSS